MVSEYFPPYIGGIEKHVMDLSNYLVDRGHEVHVFTSRESLRYSSQAIASMVSSSQHLLQVHYQNGLQLLRRLDFPPKTIVHLHNFTRGLVLKVAFKKARPKIITLHGGLLGSRFQKDTAATCAKVLFDLLFANHVLNTMDKIIALTQSEKEFLIRLFQVDPERIIVIPNWADDQAFESPSVKPKILSEVDGEYFLAVGRVSRQKSFDHFVRALQDLPRVHFVLAGQDHGDLRRLLVLSKKLKVEERFHFAGLVWGEEKYALIKNSAFVAFSSMFEMFPIAALETMAQGRPIVAVRNGGMPDIVSDGVNGFLYNFGNLQEFREKSMILMQNKKLQGIMGARGKKRALNNYRMESVGKQIESVYEETTNS